MLFKHLYLAFLASAVAAQDMMNLTATIMSTDSLSQLQEYLSMFPDLLSALGDMSNITVLAPSNDAFEAFLNTSVGGSLAERPGSIEALLQYHVLNGSYPASSITNTSSFIPTMLTNESYTNVTRGQTVEAVVIGNETVFYGGLLSNVTVSQANVNFTGGVVHIVDDVLTIPRNITDTALAANLTSLAGALTETNLLDSVNGLRDVTVFAPNNDAFQSIGTAIGNFTTDDLSNILSYHVVNGSSVGYSSHLENGTMLQTLEGGNLTITMNNGSIFVNSAEVVMPNVLVANGVVHVIDNVLNPNATMGPSTSATSGAPAFTSASTATEAPFTSDVPNASETIEGGPGAASSEAAAASTSTGVAVPMKTGAVGAAALFGAGAAFLNY
ncbi:FAS1 domain-containing protein [Lineolata rhizophorae]|uniref:FAS1 domain-containing protein n=1 Tax=Lineolata rhizophorae TaxID=578093 RepID=A0A6A6NQP5_9PEZI|nr:FAS1 domain-containing protein [Lineolata rhizophorae]